MLAKILSQRHGFKMHRAVLGRPRRHDQPEELEVALRSRGARHRRCDRHAAALPRLARRGHGALRQAAAAPASRSSRCGPARTRSTGSPRAARGRRGTTTTRAGSASACSARPGSRTGAGTRSRRRAARSSRPQRGEPAAARHHRASSATRTSTRPIRRPTRRSSSAASCCRRLTPDVGAGRLPEGARHRQAGAGRQRPGDAGGVDAAQQERQRHDQPDPDDDDGIGDGSGERRAAPAGRQRRVLGARPRRAGEGGRDLRRRIHSRRSTASTASARGCARRTSSSARRCPGSRCRDQVIRFALSRDKGQGTRDRGQRTADQRTSGEADRQPSFMMVLFRLVCLLHHPRRVAACAGGASARRGLRHPQLSVHVRRNAAGAPDPLPHLRHAPEGRAGRRSQRGARHARDRRQRRAVHRRAKFAGELFGAGSAARRRRSTTSSCPTTSATADRASRATDSARSFRDTATWTW